MCIVRHNLFSAMKNILLITLFKKLIEYLGSFNYGQYLLTIKYKNT